MKMYFASWNRFTSSNEGVKTPVEYVRGILNNCELRDGKSPSGKWVVCSLIKNDENYWVYFDAQNVSVEMLEFMQKHVGSKVTLRSLEGKPIIEPFLLLSNEEVEQLLLEGVAYGHIKIEDVPALMELGSGNYERFEGWLLYKQFLETEGLEKVKEELVRKEEALERDIAKAKEEIETMQAHLNEANEIKRDIDDEEERVMEAIFESLTFFQGDEYLEGEQTERPLMYPMGKEKLIPLPHGFVSLSNVLGQFRGSSQGLCLIGADRIYKIYYAYKHDEKGPVFLVGSSKEYLKTNPEKVKKIVDEALELHAAFKKRQKKE